jgi:hypothetical protein
MRAIEFFSSLPVLLCRAHAPGQQEAHFRCYLTAWEDFEMLRLALP